MDNMEALVAALQDPETRENALLDLSKKRHVATSRPSFTLVRCDSCRRSSASTLCSRLPP